MKEWEHKASEDEAQKIRLQAEFDAEQRRYNVIETKGNQCEYTKNTNNKDYTGLGLQNRSQKMKYGS